MRRDEGDRHRVEAPDEDRAAVREVVAGRAGRRRADDAVAGEPAEALAADRPFELDHAADDGARDHEVVDGDAPLVAHLDVERRQLLDPVLAGKDAREPALELVARDRGEKADAAEVDADHGYARCPGSGRARAASSRRRRARPRCRRPRCSASSGDPVRASTPPPRPAQLDARSRATFASRARAGPIVCGLPWVTTAALLDRLRRLRHGRSSGRCHPGARGRAVDQMEEELVVALRPG